MHETQRIIYRDERMLLDEGRVFCMLRNLAASFLLQIKMMPSYVPWVGYVSQETNIKVFEQQVTAPVVLSVALLPEGAPPLPPLGLCFVHGDGFIA